MLCLLAFPLQLQAAQKIALVVGIGNYEYLGDLQRPPTDARDVALLFRENEYKVIVESKGLNKKILQEKIDNFLVNIRLASKAGPVEAVFYYSGHGFEAEHNNWLVTADFNPEGYSSREARAMFSKYGLTLESILTSIRSAGAAKAVIILDACREVNFQFADKSLVNPGFDVAVSKIPKSFFVMYAAGREEPAYSSFPGDEGRHSVFTHFFLKRAANPKIEISALLNLIQADVEIATASRKPPQSPSGYDAISGDHFLFAPASPAGVIGVPQIGSTIGIFYRMNREEDARDLADAMRRAGVFYGLVADDLAQIKMKLPTGAYRIVRSSSFSSEDRMSFDKVFSLLEAKAGAGNVVVTTLPPASIINKPFQVQLF